MKRGERDRVGESRIRNGEMWVNDGRIGRIEIKMIGDEVNGWKRLERILEGRRLRRKNDWIRKLKKRSRKVGKLREGGKRRGNNRLKNMGWEKERIEGEKRIEGNMILNEGKVLKRKLKKEIEEGKNKGVGKIDNLIKKGKRMRILDIGNEEEIEERKIEKLGKILREMDKGKRKKIDILIKKGIKIEEVFISKREKEESSVGKDEKIEVGNEGEGKKIEEDRIEVEGLRKKMKI